MLEGRRVCMGAIRGWKRCFIDLMQAYMIASHPIIHTCRPPLLFSKEFCVLDENHHRSFPPQTPSAISQLPPMIYISTHISSSLPFPSPVTKKCGKTRHALLPPSPHRALRTPYCPNTPSNPLLSASNRSLTPWFLSIYISLIWATGIASVGPGTPWGSAPGGALLLLGACCCCS